MTETLAEVRMDTFTIKQQKIGLAGERTYEFLVSRHAPYFESRWFAFDAAPILPKRWWRRQRERTWLEGYCAEHSDRQEWCGTEEAALSAAVRFGLFGRLPNEQEMAFADRVRVEIELQKIAREL